MYQQNILHPSLEMTTALDATVYQAMFDIFKHIGLFWNNLENPQQYRTRLITFMDNRMSLRPEYRQHYQLAAITMQQLCEELGEQAAYEKLFTDSDANCPHTNTPLAITRQKVSNEFITFQLNQGGFKAFGADGASKAENAQGYISGAYIPSQPVPYRTADDQLEEK